MTGAFDGIEFRTLVEQAPTILFAATPDGAIAYVNEAYRTYCGTAADDVLGDAWTTRLHAADKRRVVDRWFEAMANGTPFREEFRFRDRHGEYRWIIAFAIPSFDAGDDVTMWYGSCFPVDARRTAEQALASLADAIPQLVWAYHADGEVFHVNQRWIDYTGLSVHHAREHGWVHALHPDDRPRANERWHEALASGKFHDDRPYRLRRNDGVFRWFLMHAVAVRDEHGAIVRWYGTGTDVDDQHRTSQRRALVARLGLAFAESLDYERTARTVVSAMCENFADFACIDMLGGDGRLERIALEVDRLGGDRVILQRLPPPPEATQHPINIALRTGRPVLAATVDDASLRAASWSAEHLALQRTLPIGSIAYVPLVAAGETVGVLTFGATVATGRRLSSADIEDAQEIARQAAIALANARLYRDLAASEGRYRRIIETAQEGVWILNADARTRYTNVRMAEMIGYTPEEMAGRPMSSFMDGEAAGEARDAFEAQREGAAQQCESRLIHKDGRPVWVLIASNPLHDEQGRFIGTLSMLTDITQRKAIETQYRLLAEAAPMIVFTANARGALTYVNERWTALTGASRDDASGYGWCRCAHRDDLVQMLTLWRAARESGDDLEAECRLRRASDGDYRWQLVRARPRRDAAGTIVEWIGSMTDIDTTRRLAHSGELLARAGEVLSSSLDRRTLLARFAQLLVDEVAGEATIRLADGTTVVRRREVLHAGAPVLQLALRHRGVAIGTVTLRGTKSVPSEDAELLEELALRAAIAIENAELFEREHHVAVTLQCALLPVLLPSVDGMAFDAAYYPGASDAQIGGDWYDAIALDDGRVVVSIGDVTGRGLQAAVIMGRTRQAIETLATYESDPQRLLEAADVVLRRSHPEAIVTALVAVIDPAAQTLSYATAGHPPPIVRAADGTIRSLPGRGLPLGLRDALHPPVSTLVLPPSALVVFFTDGLIESTRDIVEGERRVFAALRDPTLTEGIAPAAAIVARVLDDVVRDDVAVLTARISGKPTSTRAWTLRWRFDPSQPHRAYDVRDAFVETLRGFGEGIDVDAALLVFGELVANAIRHAPGSIDVELSWDDPATPVLHVVDDGPGFASQTRLPAHDAESGRGLYMVAQLTREFTVTKLPGRGAHARAVLLPAEEPPAREA